MTLDIILIVAGSWAHAIRIIDIVIVHIVICIEYICITTIHIIRRQAPELKGVNQTPNNNNSKGITYHLIVYSLHIDIIIIYMKKTTVTFYLTVVFDIFLILFYIHQFSLCVLIFLKVFLPFNNFFIAGKHIFPNPSTKYITTLFLVTYPFKFYFIPG